MKIKATPSPAAQKVVCDVILALAVPPSKRSASIKGRA